MNHPTQQLTREGILYEVKKLIWKLTFYEDKIEEGHDLKNDLDIDSLEKTELLMECEKCFDVDIRDEDYGGIQTVKDLADFIWNKIENKN